MTGLAIAPRRLASPFTPSVGFDTADFSVRLARRAEERDAAFRLRFEVFNLELGEGLAESHARGRDEDAFDAQCDHLLVEERSSGRVVGTYRLQTLEQARAGRGFYTATEFPPVLDREFGTIDFLTVFDIEAAGTRTRDFFFPQEARRRSA